MSNDLRAQVEDPHAHPDIQTARNLMDASDSQHSLEGYASVNGLGGQDEVARLAYEFFQERQHSGLQGSADGDWFRAEAEVRRRRESADAA